MNHSNKLNLRRKRNLGLERSLGATLRPGEEIVYQSKRHPAILGPPAVITAVILLASGLLLRSTNIGRALEIPLRLIQFSTLAYFLYHIMHYNMTQLVVSSRRVLEITSLGLIARVTTYPVHQQTIVRRESPIQRLLNFGTVDTRTIFNDRIHSFAFVTDAKVFVNAILEVEN